MAILICSNLCMIIHITVSNYLDLICMIDDIFELLLQWQDLHAFMDRHLLLSLCFQTKLSWGSKKLRTFFHFAFKKKLTSCVLRERESIWEHARKQNHLPDQIGLRHPKSKTKRKCAAKNKIMHQTELDSSTQNPRTKRKCTANHKSQ